MSTVLRLLDIMAITAHRSTRPYSAGIQRAIHHIEQNEGEMPGIAQLARVAGMSESYFKVVFKRETSMPPVEYVIWRRLERAKGVLRTTFTSITRLAMDFGFTSSQHFATVFKRLTGETPSAYRKRVHLHLEPSAPVVGAGPDFHPAVR